MFVRACVFLSVNCIQGCYTWMWSSSGDFVYACIYDSFSEFVHLAVFVCGCAHACACVYLCGYECVQECMRALWQVYSPLFVWVGEIFVSMISLHGPG